MTLTRCISEYDKVSRSLLKSYPIDCALEDMKKLFDVGVDDDMICVYQITTEEQKAFFTDLGVSLESGGLYYVESW